MPSAAPFSDAAPYSIDGSLHIGTSPKNRDLTDRFSYSLDAPETYRRDDAWSFERLPGTDGFRLYLSMSGITRFSEFHVNRLPRKFAQTPFSMSERMKYSLVGRKPAMTAEVDFSFDLEHVLATTFYHSTINAIPISHHYRRRGAFRPVPEIDDTLYQPDRSVKSHRTKTIPLQLEKEFLYLTRAKNTERGVSNLMLLWRDLYRQLIKQQDAYAIRKQRHGDHITFSEEPVGDGFISSTSPMTRMLDSFNLALGDAIVSTSRSRFAKTTVLKFKQYLEREEEKRQEQLRRAREAALLLPAA